MQRKTPLVTGNAYHIFSKSISHFQIFNNPNEYGRFLQLLRFYCYGGLTVPLSKICRDCQHKDALIDEALCRAIQGKTLRARILAYCLMPTHFHLLLHQAADQGITLFMRDVCSAYSHFFNLRHNRQGPLWEHRFGSEAIFNDTEQLAVSRYIHLNPTTDYLTDHPASWPWSSFKEYLGQPVEHAICQPDLVLCDISPAAYEEFVVSHIEEQRRRKKLRTNPDPRSDQTWSERGSGVVR